VVVWHFAANTRAGSFYEREGYWLDGGRRLSRFGVEEVRRTRSAPP
jgi:hypothetical protein